MAHFFIIISINQCAEQSEAIMTEEQLIKQLKQLKQIKPTKEWVILAKKQVFVGDEPQPKFRFASPRLDFQFSFRKFAVQPAFVVSSVLLLAIGITAFLVVQNSLPGEPFYSVKKATERVEESIVSERNKAEFCLDLAERRAEKLKEIVDNNQTTNLFPAIKEYKESLRKAAESLSNGPKEPEQTIKIARKVTELTEKTEEFEKNLNIPFEEIGDLKEKTIACLKKDIENTKNDLAVLVGREIKSLENSSLTEKQKKLLAEAKVLYEAEKYDKALEKIWQAGQIR